MDFSEFNVIDNKILSQISGGASKDIQYNLKKYRTLSGISQDRLADLLCVSQVAVSNYETGKRIPDIDNLIKLSNILQTSVPELIAPHNETL
ncbi:SOS-response transcriptional repressor [Leuconostoc kimchii IMSNU 11154]|uniref:SOS-response transcriptional repressor n=1 Tax=Leuconostoc kimchii (strain IMSNU 11154 / KCTC 2386 / IH25) TaxID=762051 RepID=D5T258_LEUKI|nr:helix-turn-helix transcriptional regulator [Leuconostoc kimchii]ADG40357.1 SOS-response transcriptional repressor [Leuconostoc kimchii IMSNU 11154]